MHKRILGLVFVYLCFQAGQITVQAQEFNLFDRTVQVHGFVSQGFVCTNDNNWLTMNTSQGSAAFTDFGLDLSAQLTDKLRVGAQGYDRNLGRLGQYHPSLDWAFADYRFKSWFGVRAGKVKTSLGLYNDTQDEDFLHTFALLPESVYPNGSPGRYYCSPGRRHLRQCVSEAPSRRSFLHRLCRTSQRQHL